MRVLGLGVDIIDIRRFKKFKNREAIFLKKVFTNKELNYCFSFSDCAPHLAGIFSAKEAAVKALGGKVSILDIEIRHHKNGQPAVYIQNKIIKTILVSISHTDRIILAAALKINI